MQDHYAGTHRFGSIVNLNIAFDMKCQPGSSAFLHPVSHLVPNALAHHTLFVPNTYKSRYDVGDEAERNEELGRDATCVTHISMS